jgi:predicted AAA+ superfamily ATPase
MRPWHEVATPHRDIHEGRFDESVFAADLADAVAGRGPLEYRDAETFFRKTYPTQGLVNLLAAVQSRLSGQGRGEAVIQIQTPFGGGKTHSLIALYHFFTRGRELGHLDVVRQVLGRSGAESVATARVFTFVGTAPDALRGRTPWGELALQLGTYELLTEHDRQRVTPGKERLHEVLGGALRRGPLLLIMDEIAEYVVKAAEGFDHQVMAFFQELTETVKVLDRCALVVTLPSSAPYGERGERVLDQLQRIFGRVEAIYTPVEGEEIYEVIRRRLFEDLGDPGMARAVAEEYWQLYQRLGDDVPAEVRKTDFRDRLRRAYPFHPELIDVLFERWSTFPTFQSTRGVLRLLAEVVGDLFARHHPAPLIQSAHVNLANPSIRREFIKHIGNQFEGVVASDVADTNAKAQRIDREMGSEYARFGVASGLATTIFLYSFSGGEKRGITLPRLRLAFLREGIPPAIVADGLHRLEEELWYLHAEQGTYYFSSQPNLNRVLIEKEENVKEDEILKEIRERLERMAGSEMEVRLFPRVAEAASSSWRCWGLNSPGRARQRRGLSPGSSIPGRQTGGSTRIRFWLWLPTPVNGEACASVSGATWP